MEEAAGRLGERRRASPAPTQALLRQMDLLVWPVFLGVLAHDHEARQLGVGRVTVEVAFHLRRTRLAHTASVSGVVPQTTIL